MSVHSWRIEHSWDGVPLSPSEHVFFALEATSHVLRVRVDAPFYNDPPPVGPVGSLDGLWNHEVVELFVAGPVDEEGKIPYLEVELSPHGHFLVIQLHGIRQRQRVLESLLFDADIRGERWEGRADIPWEWLPPGPHRCNAYAIHGLPAQRIYSAMQPVPGEQPDFHRLQHFVPMDWGDHSL